MSTQTVIYGGTFDPPHHGHVAAALWLAERFADVVVVPAIGHEFKQDRVVTYLHRRTMLELAFAGLGPSSPSVGVLEEIVLPEVGLPVMAIDMLRYAKRCGAKRPVFAIGPDIDPTTWTGYREIMGEGFGFVRIPKTTHPRSTDIRNMIANGDQTWQEHVSPLVAEYIKKHGLYGLPKPARVWKTAA